MKQIIEATLGIFKTAADCYIIWLIGPDGTIFDLLSIFKIIGSGLALAASIAGLAWKLSRKM